FARSGQAQAAQAATDKANMLRKQDADLQKSQADAFQAYGKGSAAFSDMWKDAKPIEDKTSSTGWSWARFGPNGAVDNLHVAAPPPQGPAQVQVSYDKEGNRQLVDMVAKAYGAANDATTALQVNNQMRAYLDRGIIAGSGSEFRQGVQTLWKTLGFDPGNSD